MHGWLRHSCHRFSFPGGARDLGAGARDNDFLAFNRQGRAALAAKFAHRKTANVMCLAEPGRQYVFYLPKDGQVFAPGSDILIERL